MRGRVQGIECIASPVATLTRIGIRRRHCIARLLHEPLGRGQRRTDVGRDQRVLPLGLPHLLLQSLDAFLDGALLRTQLRRGLTLLESPRHAELLLRQPAHIRQRLVQLRQHLIAPVFRHLLPLFLQVIAQRGQFLLGLLALLLCLLLLALFR